MRFGVDLGPEDVLPKGKERQGPESSDSIEGFFASIERYMQLANSILAQLANLQDNPFIRQVLEQRGMSMLGQGGGAMTSSDKGSDIDLDKLCELGIALVNTLSSQYGDKTLSELADMVNSAPRPILRREVEKIVTAARK